MAQTVLEQLLARRLIPVEDDPTLEKVQATADELAKKIRTGKISAAVATLVALDSQIPATDPMGDVVMAELRKHWKSVDQKHPDRPMTLVRGILADALSQAGKDAAVAAAAMLTARSFWPYAAVGEELPVWDGILRALGETASRAATSVWDGQSADVAINVPSLKLDAPKPKAVAADEALLRRHLAAAVGSTSSPPDGVAPNNGAMTTQGYAVNVVWADKFGVMAGSAIAQAITAAVKSVTPSLDVGDIGAAVESYGQSLAGALGTALRPLHATMLRSQVLLWREAMYSPRLQLNYRRVAPSVRAVAQAADLHEIVPAHSPLAVESLLEEAARAADGGEELTIPEFVDGLRREMPPELASALGRAKAQPGRVTLLGLVRESLGEGVAADTLQHRLGIGPSVEVPLLDLTLWMYRDLQAERLLSGK